MTKISKKIYFFTQTTLTSCLISLALLGLSANYAILDPNNMGWLFREDFSPAILGSLFYSLSEFTFPFGSNPLYGGEISASTLYSGSVPIVSLIYKLLRKNGEFQIYGFFYLFCFFMQGIGGIILYKNLYKFRFQRHPNINLIEVIFIQFFFIFAPVFVANISHNFNLQSHFLIILLLALFFSGIDSEKPLRTIIGMMAICMVASLFDAYILLCCLFLYSGFTLYNIKKFTSQEIFFVAVMLPIALFILMYSIGYFGFGGTKSDCCFGRYPINLLGFFIPKISSDLPTLSYILGFINFPTGWGVGYCFLGTIPALILVFYFKRIFAFFKPIAKVSLFFALPTLVLAITNEIHIANLNLVIPIPSRLVEYLSVFRGSGRLIWPFYYTLLVSILLFCILLIDKTRFKNLLLICSILITIADMSQGLHLISMRFNKQNNYKPIQEVLDFCASNNCKSIDYFEPTQAKIRYESVSYTAYKLGIPTNAIYLARFNYEKAYEITSRNKKNICDNQNSVLILSKREFHELNLNLCHSSKIIEIYSNDAITALYIN
jgi:Family of unknown function (DUF6311)